MTLRRRPRAGGDPYAAAKRCGRAGDNRDLGGYGSPPARGRRRLGSRQKNLSTLYSRVRGDDAERAEHLQWLSSLVALGAVSALRLEMAQVGRRLPFLRRHQEPVGAEEVAFLADGDMI